MLRPTIGSPRDAATLIKGTKFLSFATSVLLCIFSGNGSEAGSNATHAPFRVVKSLSYSYMVSSLDFISPLAWVESKLQTR